MAFPPAFAGAGGPRVVSLDSCSDQLVLALADDHQIIALSRDSQGAFSYYKERARGFPQHSGTPEEILLLRPELVLSTGAGDPGLKLMLEELGIRVVSTGLPASIEEALEDLEFVGEVLGQAEKAQILKAKTEATLAGFDEAIILNHDGHVCEGSGENIFVVSNGRLITSSLEDNVLPGITRDTIIQLAQRELGLEVVQRSIDRSELYLADEIFLTGTAAHLTPVIELDNRKIADGNVGPISAKLQKMYFDVVVGRNPKYLHWCTPAEPRLIAA
ncbi:MAG: aminotransferase class IV [Proteobacteria bacterium]|nr:aminotransferase class IV [Pseudomonadota bacterium]